MPGPDDAAIALAKSELRARLRATRRRIAADPVDRKARSERIGVALLAALDAGGRPAHRVMLFESLPTEPDTSRWIVDLRAAGAEVLMPEVDGSDLRIQPGDLDPAALDVVVVPGLAFTADGRRLGQGGGHYDRFLPQLSASCLTIGVCFDEQVVADVPMAPFDRRVDVVVTDALPR